MKISCIDKLNDSINYRVICELGLLGYRFVEYTIIDLRRPGYIASLNYQHSTGFVYRTICIGRCFHIELLAASLSSDAVPARLTLRWLRNSVRHQCTGF